LSFVSCQDDLEALGHMLVSLGKKKLPWNKTNYKKLIPKKQRFQYLAEKYLLVEPKKLCEVIMNNIGNLIMLEL
jgi:hypothetical protein